MLWTKQIQETEQKHFLNTGIVILADGMFGNP